MVMSQDPSLTAPACVSLEISSVVSEGIANSWDPDTCVCVPICLFATLSALLFPRAVSPYQAPLPVSLYMHVSLGLNNLKHTKIPEEP